MPSDQSILFATPCYGNMVIAAHFRSCLNLKEELTKAGLAHDWLVGWNESLVHRARMTMAKAFLDSKHSHLFWLDADIEFEPQDVADLWNMNADVAVGCYAMKKVGADWYAAWHKGKLVKGKDLDKLKEPIEVDYAGTGFMLIKREVLEKMAGHSQSYESEDGPVPALFMTPIFDGVLESEDYNFCRRARQLGFKIMMDPKVRLKHWGTYAFGA